MTQQTQNKSLDEILAGYKADIQPGELEDLLSAVKTLKHGSGWGRIELIYLNSEVNDIEIAIKRKPKKQKPV